MNLTFKTRQLRLYHDPKGQGKPAEYKTLTLSGFAESADAEGLGRVAGALDPLCGGNRAGAEVVTVSDLA